MKSRAKLLVEQLESSVEFLTHQMKCETRASEVLKLAKEISQAKGQLMAARMEVEI